MTTSRWSPARRTVRRSGTSVWSSRITRETDAPWGSRSSPTSTPCISDRGLIVTWSRSAATRSSGAASTSRSRGSERRATRSTRAAHGNVGPVSSVNTTTITKTRSKSRSLPSIPSASGIVVSTIGTAPRSPAQDRKASSRHGIGCTTALTATEIGRATRVRTSPAASARPTVDRVIRPGESSRPSMTNSPIWASQATPSAKDRVAPRWGSSEFPSTSAATYTAAKPEPCRAAATP